MVKRSQREALFSYTCVVCYLNTGSILFEPYYPLFRSCDHEGHSRMIRILRLSSPGNGKAVRISEWRQLSAEISQRKEELTCFMSFQTVKIFLPVILS